MSVESAVRKKRSVSQGMRLALEFGPLVVFFLANSQAHRFFGNAPDENIFYATGAFMVAITAALAVSWALMRRLPAMPLITGVMVLFFGGLTLYLQDEFFIKVKPTIVNSMFAAALLIAYALKKPALELLFNSVFYLEPEGWRKLTLRWALFFIFLAVLNEVVWRNFSTDVWVNFKVFGIMPLTMVFAISQVGLLQRYQLEKPKRSGDGE